MPSDRIREANARQVVENLPPDLCQDAPQVGEPPESDRYPRRVRLVVILVSGALPWLIIAVIAWMLASG